MPDPLPNKPPFFLLRYPRSAELIIVEVTWCKKCFRFFRIQKTEVMLIDDRNIVEIHATRFFSEVAAVTRLQEEKEDLGRSDWKACGWEIKKRIKAKKKEKNIFHLSQEKPCLQHILTRPRKTPCLSYLSKWDFSETARCSRDALLKLLELKNGGDRGSGVLWKVSKFREGKIKMIR
ncbi:hypothetical protein CEXT_366771 [Caerostris extrusa]|uniref:Uncharacterized protein n=1 Tax=Caerostris extrusa TaxID=172846 RepID=A0AAV4W521_CAEEX|nr:hypothetical protein CEXT_366771 [Caerostris extrusa]